MDITKDLALSIFNLDKNYSEADVEQEFKRLSSIVHPDNGGDVNLFVFINRCKKLLLSSDNYLAISNKSKKFITLQSFYSFDKYSIDSIFDKHGIDDIRCLLRLKLVCSKATTEENLVFILHYPYIDYCTNNSIQFQVDVDVPNSLKNSETLFCIATLLDSNYRFKVMPSKTQHETIYFPKDAFVWPDKPYTSVQLNFNFE